MPLARGSAAACAEARRPRPTGQQHHAAAVTAYEIRFRELARSGNPDSTGDQQPSTDVHGPNPVLAGAGSAILRTPKQCYLPARALPHHLLWGDTCQSLAPGRGVEIASSNVG